jgi:hypothetical protein
MIDPTNLGPLALLGAVGATIAASWNHLRNVFGYLSTFILVDVTYPDTTSSLVRRYLKGSGAYRRLPGGDVHYTIIFSQIFGHKASDDRIPLRNRMASTNILVGPGGLLFTKVGPNYVKIRALRGLFNSDRLLNQALDWTQHDRPDGSRFTIYNVAGTEKGPWATVREKLDQGERSLAVSDSDLPYDTDLDHSIKYDRSQWVAAASHNPFDNLFYDEQVLGHVEDIRTWLTQGNWYKERGIPWRRGILWHGPAGTGKSSIVRAIAELLGLPVYVFHLSTMSDQEFMEMWRAMCTPAVVLFEDFDTVFNLREPLTSHKSLTFECLLNTISGVNTVSGTLLMVTTNHLDKIDHALLNRPGRIDAVVEIGVMGEQQRLRLARKVLQDWPELVEESVAEGQGMTPVLFQEHCVRKALHRLAEIGGPANLMKLETEQ